MKIILALAFFIAFSASALAETITVINEDGTKTSIEIGPVPDVPPVTAAPVKKPAASAAAKTPAKTPEKTQVKAPAKQAVKPAVKPAVTQAAKPATKPAKKPVKAAPSKKAANNTAAKAKTTQAGAAKPPAQSAAPATPSASAPATASAAAPAQSLGPAMTPDDAIRIALDAAPPSRSVHAVPVNYKGLHAYQVVFKTEEGDRSIFVDRESGRIVK